jgi:hypothetical protein
MRNLSAASAHLPSIGLFLLLILGCGLSYDDHLRRVGR